MKRIARFCIFSNLSMSPLRYGFQIVAPYSAIIDRTICRLFFYNFLGCFLGFSLRKTRVALAILHTAWLFTQIHQNTASNYIISIILRCLMNNCIRCWYVCSIWGRLKIVDWGMSYLLLLEGCGYLVYSVLLNFCWLIRCSIS